MSRRFLPSTVLAASLALCAACIEEPPAGEAPGPGEDIASYGEPALPGISHPDPRLTAKLARALVRRGDDYVPRTRHLRADGSPEFTNRLILESSPYLLQHAHNPVNWFAWSDDAFERAMREGKPVLLSVGYSTCHWCHVMERESFEDVEIATFLNEHFVAIKVDREERPDVDDIYMTAVQALTGRGGWPMTVVMTPDRQPFFGGTYFPARDGDRGAGKGFLTMLGELAALYRDEPTRVAERARAITSEIQQAVRSERPGDVPGPGGIHLAAARFSYAFDEQWGGFGGAPKFPRPATYELLARYFRRSRDQRALVMVERSLERMAAGGIYDQIGGGFHRYSTDATWTVPHFEKMLYDNAQLASLYLEAFQLTGRREFARIAAETLDYVRREMTSPRGAFYSATDAESTTPDGRHAEGYFFTWTPEELVAVLGESRARAFGAYYGVSERGHVDGRSVLTARRSLASVARSLDVEPGALEESLSESRALLYAARAKRPAPLRDEKVLTSWNALMISAFARGAFVLGSADYLGVARRAAEFLLTTLRTEDGRLLRTFIDGEARLSGYLDDYAFLVQALLDLYEASFERQWLAAAIALQSKLDELYLDDADGAYFLTPNDHERLLARPKPSYDGAEPSGNSIAVLNLLRLHEVTTEERYRRQAERVLAAFAGALAEGSTAHPKMLAALDYYLDEPFEVVLLWPRGAAHDGPLLEKLRRLFLPSRAVVGASEGEEAASLEALVPLIAEKKAIEGRATAYVCKQGICKRPTSDPEVLAEQLSAVVALMGEVPVPPLPVPR